MTIQEAIKARIDRFNRLYLAAVGHSFEDDPKWCEEQIKKEFPVWNKKVNSRLKGLIYHPWKIIFTLDVMPKIGYFLQMIL